MEPVNYDKYDANASDSDGLDGLEYKHQRMAQANLVRSEDIMQDVEEEESGLGWTVPAPASTQKRYPGSPFKSDRRDLKTRPAPTKVGEDSNSVWPPGVAEACQLFLDEYFADPPNSTTSRRIPEPRELFLASLMTGINVCENDTPCQSFETLLRNS